MLYTLILIINYFETKVLLDKSGSKVKINWSQYHDKFMSKDSHTLFSWEWSSGYVWRYHHCSPNCHTQNEERNLYFLSFLHFIQTDYLLVRAESLVICFTFSPSELPSFALPFFCLGCVKSARYLLAALFSCMHTWSYEQTLSVTAVNSGAERIEYKH